MRLSLVILIIFILIQTTFHTYADDLFETQGMVATAHSLATNVAVEILNQGGNAVDAAVAAMFALPIVEPWASGLGGGGFMLIHDAESDTEYSIDYRERAPIGATRDMYLDEEGNVDVNRSRYSHLASGVPGTVRGFWLAHQKGGRAVCLVYPAHLKEDRQTCY